MSDQQRKFYRIVYPHLERPVIKITGNTYEVVDLSEAGVCFAIPLTYRPNVGNTVHADIRFHNGRGCKVIGTVLRVNEDEQTCILQLTQGIPFSVVMEQQRYLLKKYPKIKDE